MSDAGERRTIWEGIRRQLIVAIERGDVLERELDDLHRRAEENRYRVSNLRKHDQFWSSEVGEPTYSEVNEAAGRPDDNQPTPADGDGDAPDEAVTPGDANPWAQRMSHADMARLILKETGRDGMTTDEFVEEMLKRNHPLPEDPTTRRTSVYSGLWRRKRDFYKDGEVWRLKIQA